MKPACGLIAGLSAAIRNWPCRIWRKFAEKARCALRASALRPQRGSKKGKKFGFRLSSVLSLRHLPLNVFLLKISARLGK